MNAPAVTSSPFAGVREIPRRLVEWIWSPSLQRRASNARGLRHLSTPFIRRGKVHASMAAQLVQAPAAYDHDAGGQRVVVEAALGMYRQSAWWLLRALAPEVHPGTNLDEALTSADVDVLAFAGGSEDTLARSREALAGYDLYDIHTRSDEELASDLDAARRLVDGLLIEIEIRTTGSKIVWQRRTRRILSVVFLAMLTAWLIVMLPRWIRPDLAENAVWTTSSSGEFYPTTGRGFAAQPGRPPIFFHTSSEENPWIEFDLGGAKSVHGVTVENRTDCCQERAVPLIVEVSSDHAQWTTVAQRTDTFNEWTVWFSGQTARYVRFRAPRATVLHFKSVTIK